MTKTLIQLKNVSKTFLPPLSYRELIRLRSRGRPPIQALDNICFSLPENSVLGLLGPNGAGKTTLIKMLATLILPDKGYISINNMLTGKDDEAIKACIGLASSDERSFYWRLNGRQNLEFFGKLHNMSQKEVNLRMEELCHIFKVAYLKQRFDSYSTGMKRKFSLMRALLHKPAVLLLDEPTKSLDYSSSKEMRHLIQDEARKGKTIILATHNIEEARQLCNYLLILAGGKVKAFGEINELEKAWAPADLAEAYLRLTGDD